MTLSALTKDLLRCPVSQGQLLAWCLWSRGVARLYPTVLGSSLPFSIISSLCISFSEAVTPFLTQGWRWVWGSCSGTPHLPVLSQSRLAGPAFHSAPSRLVLWFFLGHLGLLECCFLTAPLGAAVVSAGWALLLGPHRHPLQVPGGAGANLVSPWVTL